MCERKREKEKIPNFMYMMYLAKDPCCVVIVCDGPHTLLILISHPSIYGV